MTDDERSVAWHWLVAVKKVPPSIAEQLLTDGLSDLAVEAIRTARFVLLELKAAGERPPRE